MAQYRKKPVVVEAVQWNHHGKIEDSVVRYFRHPSVAGESYCAHCGLAMWVHGWIDTLEGGHIVCPGDWIITGVKGECYPVKNDIFHATYEPVGVKE